MDRRRFLTATTASIPFVAGCTSSAAIGQSQPPEVTSTSVTVTDSRCTDAAAREQRAEASYDSPSHLLTIEGTINAETPCTELAVTSKTGVGRDEYANDSMHISIDHASHGGCNPCPAALDYTADVRFSHGPSTVYLYHIEKQDSEWKRVGPIATNNLD